MVMRIVWAIMVAIVFLTGWSMVAQAATITISEDENGPFIFYAGSVEHDRCDKWQQGYCTEVVPRDSFRIMKILQTTPIRRIKMSSGGGVAQQGYDMGSLLRQYGVSAEVPKGAYCLSACAIAFAGAVDHKVEGVLGFHATWTSAQHLMPIQAMASGQYIATKRAKYFMMMGFHYDLADIIVTATSPSVFFVFKDTESFQDFYVGPWDGIWGLLVPKEYDEEYFKDKFMEGKVINEYVVSQRMEILRDMRREALARSQEEVLSDE